MNPLDLTYCETHEWLHMAQPWNTASNALFFIVAAVLIFQMKRAGVKDKALLWLSLSITLIGATSTFWHATQYPWSLILDVLGIIVFAVFYIYYSGLKLLNWSVARTSLGIVGVIAACVVAMKLTDAHMAQRSGAFIPLSLLFIGLSAKTWRVSRVNALYFLGAGVGMAFAIMARVLDVPFCSHMDMGTHFLWHSFAAITAYCIMIPVLRARSS